MNVWRMNSYKNHPTTKPANKNKYSIVIPLSGFRV